MLQDGMSNNEKDFLRNTPFPRVLNSIGRSFGQEVRLGAARIVADTEDVLLRTPGLFPPPRR